MNEYYYTYIFTLVFLIASLMIILGKKDNIQHLGLSSLFISLSIYININSGSLILNDLPKTSILFYLNGLLFFMGIYFLLKTFKKKRKIVCLIGSTKFKEAFEKANKEESLKGNIILTVAMFGHLEGLDMDSDAKRIFDKIHLDKINLSDEVLVLNVNGYIGESTKKELEYAIKKSKKIRYLEKEVK